MIKTLAPKSPDPLLKIIKMFREDTRSDKIDLGVGVYKDARGNTPVMQAVKDAEALLLATQKTKTYVGQQGDVDFLKLVGQLAFGEMARDFVSIQAVGGTGALRLGCDLLRESGAKRIVLPQPCWPNHPAIVRAARLKALDAPFFDVAEQRIDMDALMDGITQAERGDAVILQAVCHNPLGADFSADQWLELADALNARGIIPFLDLAYQGFGDGIDEDVAGARAFLERVPEAVIAVSEAKTFGIYRERVGALYVKSAEKARPAVMSNLAAIARANYSMPPDHGASIVREVLGDEALRQSWRDELDAIRGHMKRTRAKLAEARVNSLPMHLIAGQKGMFSTLPLSEAQVGRLREEHGIYMTDSARINVAGLREADIPRFVEALKAVA
ncbi:amino acid aminotransferase [Terricaulis silvestris]|uniref:Aromatic-amino-acid aminotransferase n=1 Tax=Terricaulis silvestris TaxID=2686094 RepID=A0A6I6MMA0_9CAUL|nr:aromatic amino acid transaminase [Terricaulis silvestris]QGZ93847.1 Aromatic-amino-acid aminotransferase [Terricaulis silvestris]